MPHYSVDLRIQKYTELVPLKYGNSPQNIRGHTDIFLQCTAALTDSTEQFDAESSEDEEEKEEEQSEVADFR